MEPKEHSETDLDRFLALETRVWEALIAGDAAADAAMLSDDFLGVYSSGFAGRDDHAAQLADGPVMQRYQMDQARIFDAGEGHVMLCYRATFLRRGRRVQEQMYVSTLWRRDSAGWRSVFSQDTPAS